jgi:hypothetical protein
LQVITGARGEFLIDAEVFNRSVDAVDPIRANNSSEFLISIGELAPTPVPADGNALLVLLVAAILAVARAHAVRIDVHSI